MSAKYIKISPQDPLFFRPGKPFDKGDDSAWIPSTVIPSPSVIWGAIFTYLWSKAKELWAEADNPWSEASKNRDKLILKRVFLYDWQSCAYYLPAPYDLYKVDGQVVSYRYVQMDDILAPVRADYLVFPGTQKLGAKHLKGYFINVNSLENYFKKQDSLISVRHFSEFLSFHPKVGITKSRTTHTSKKSHLYSIDMIEMREDVSFVAEIEIKDEDLAKALPENEDFIRLGGEGKLAKFSELQNNEIPKVPDTFANNSKDANFIKVLFVSPAFLTKSLNELQELGLLAASIGKPMYIGGWDIQKNKPKPVRKALPPGSVMVFDAKKWNETGFNNFFCKSDDVRYGFNKYITYKY